MHMVLVPIEGGYAVFDTRAGKRLCGYVKLNQRAGKTICHYAVDLASGVHGPFPDRLSAADFLRAKEAHR